MVIEGSLSSSLRVSVVLPAPEGDEITRRRPRRSMGMVLALFNVLHLLAHLIYDGFEAEPDAAQRFILRLGAKSIGFAMKFLRQKIELAADRTRAVFQQVMGSADMGEDAVELFLDIAL